jgi:hypothetical protein
MNAGAGGSGGTTAAEPSGAGGTRSDAAVAASTVPNRMQPFCPGSMAPSMVSTCATDADCGMGQRCLFANTPWTCTLGCAGRFDRCTTDADCMGGLVCHVDFSPWATCSCGGGNDCKEKCTSDSACLPGYACTSNGTCVPRTCDDGSGYACGVTQLCDRMSAEADIHGCRALRCDEAGGAPCGTNHTCDASDARAVRGCAPTRCTSGDDCECGACSPWLVRGARECVPTPGFCGQQL